ncbi:HpcH/HpaI aldolase/citrate lyase family protein [Kitasatospora sp. RB6PN24]|uniref:HpcH/HpaI aldolase/citrate lyase family protein n=1 Tax=Kitasatospora humi TaxID=2893891 RepID=UPI001E36E52D|nr:HpcH/HpaI aldolase/citrate lyase family protein [Kitasatospora humi]MCC9310043.1 HpcH/HpaI aldolase/citrate lyase family protein [Kitasatospora humi]
MRHFGQLGAELRRRLFHVEPQPFDRRSDAPVLAAALGATLYCPATRPALAADVRRQAARGAVSMVLCLEDAIADSQVRAAEANLLVQLAELAAGPEDGLPLLFVRVRTAEQIGDLTRRLGAAARLLSGCVLPKFTEATGPGYLERLAEAEAALGQRLFAMPVLESPELAHLERRRSELLGVAEVLAKHRERILAVRLGVTDLCAAYGLRRSPELTAYDLPLVASVIGDVVNVLGRADGTGFTLTGPVWEYFPLPGGGPELDGLRRELELDLANGLLGKTCVHPSQLPVVHARAVVTHEEYCDASDILRREAGGVSASDYRNKMNEAGPHRRWAERVLRRAAAFGVARSGVGFAELLSAVRGG